MDEGVRLYAKMEYPEMSNDKEIAIVLHGLAGNMEEHQIDTAAKAFRQCGMVSLRVDMQGHGNSDGLYAKHTLFKWISNICAVIDKVKEEGHTDIYLCGHSQGGLAAMFAAKMRIDDIKALVLLSPAVNICHGLMEGKFLGYSFDPLHVPQRLKVFDGWLDGDYFRTAQLLRPRDVAQCFAKETLIVAAKEDELVPLDELVQLQSQYPMGHLSMVEGNHCYDGHDDELSEVIDDFIIRLKTVR